MAKKYLIDVEDEGQEEQGDVGGEEGVEQDEQVEGHKGADYRTLFGDEDYYDDPG